MPKALPKLHPRRKGKRGNASGWGKAGIQNVMFIIRYCSKRRQPSSNEMFTVKAFSLGACADFPAATSATRTTRCAQNHIVVDKAGVRRKRKENRELPLQRLQISDTSRPLSADNRALCCSRVKRTAQLISVY